MANKHRVKKHTRRIKRNSAAAKKRKGKSFKTVKVKRHKRRS